MIIKKRKIERNDKRGAVTKSISIFLTFTDSIS